MNIRIITNDRSGLAEIMCGYLQFYSGGRIKIYIPGYTRVIHPLAEQVLTEDGISEWNYISADSAVRPDLDIYLNTHDGNSLQEAVRSCRFTYASPETQTTYDTILSDYRNLREQIKRVCIQLVGESAALLR